MRKLHSLLLLLLLPAFVWAQDPAVVQKIKTEGLENSKVMDIAFELTEKSGPRLMASPGFYRAADYSVEQLKEWGLENVKLDPWGEFGKGWELEKSYIAMKAPWYKPLIAFPKTWTKGTNGLQNAPVVLISAKDSAEVVDKYQGKLSGAVIVMDNLIDYTPNDRVDLVRHTEAELDSLQNIEPVEPERGGGMRFDRDSDAFKAFMEARKMTETLGNLAESEGAVAILSSSPRNSHGTVFVQGGGSYNMDAPEGFLDLAMSLEDYNMIVRLLRDGTDVELEVEVATRFLTDEKNGYNVIGEIPGTDPEIGDEIVMIGGHLDSWQGATGATDNAAGSAVMMEVMRILKTLDIEPRRTVRIGLWSGEEQGIHGSRGYVAKTFADRATMELKPEHEKLSAYFNLDNGTGRIRGVYLQQNEEARELLGEWMSPFADIGAEYLTYSNTGGTDHLSFDAVGLPGFQFIQDEVEYSSRTHHSNMDSYDHLSPEDLKQAATVIAGMVYQAAMSDQKVPRKPLPEPQGDRGFF